MSYAEGRLRMCFRAGPLCLTGASGDRFDQINLCGRCYGLVIAVLRECAALAEYLAVAGDVPVVVDALAAQGADDALGFITRHLAGVERNGDPLVAEEFGIGQFAVGEHLLLVLLLNMRIEFSGPLFRGFESGDTDRLTGLEIEEGCRHLAPVTKFEGAFAEAAASHDGDGIGRATIDLDEGYESLAIGTFGIADAEPLAAEHGHANAQDLPGTKMTVGDLRFLQQFIEALHGFMIAACYGFRVTVYRGDRAADSSATPAA